MTRRKRELALIERVSTGSLLFVLFAVKETIVERNNREKHSVESEFRSFLLSFRSAAVHDSDTRLTVCQRLAGNN